MGKLAGKVALVTGGNGGIGLAPAKQFVEEGAYVFMAGRRKHELAGAVKEIGKNATGVQGDVSNLADLDRLFAQIKQNRGIGREQRLQCDHSRRALICADLDCGAARRGSGWHRRPEACQRRAPDDPSACGMEPQSSRVNTDPLDII